MVYWKLSQALVIISPRLVLAYILLAIEYKLLIAPPYVKPSLATALLELDKLAAAFKSDAVIP